MYSLKMATLKDNKVKITIKYKGDKISMLIPKNSNFTLITEYISRMVQAYDDIEKPSYLEDVDPGDEQQVSNG